MNPEMKARLEALEAERARPVPPPPSKRLPRLTPARAARNRKALEAALKAGPQLIGAAAKKRYAAERGRRTRLRRRAARMEDYAELRQTGETREAAAERVGISPSTVQRYERRRREATS